MAITLRTFRELKNFVVVAEDGSVIGKVEDILVDSFGVIQGFRIDKKGMFLRDCFLPISAPFRFVGDRMVISKKDLRPITDKIRDYQPVGEKGYIGKQVISEHGELKGLVQDVYFRSDLGRIEALEVSEGWFADLVDGRTHVNCNDVMQDGEKFLTLKNRGGGTTHEMPELLE